VIGPNANNPQVLQGNYYGNAPYLITPVAGIRNYTNVNYQPGCTMSGTSESGFAAAIAAAQTTDATVLVVGLDQSQESEGLDRVMIAFPGVQEDLIKQVCAASKGPCIVVVMSGSSVDVTAASQSDDVDGIFWVGYPGQSGGQAIADVLFGMYSLVGRLPFTFHTADFINTNSFLDMSMRPNTDSSKGALNAGRTYRFFTGQTLYPFGTGHSYTTFSYQLISSSAVFLNAALIPDVRAARSLFSEEMSAVATVVVINVTNTGTVASDDVVLSYVVPADAGMDGNPIRYLAGFQRIHLIPGQSQLVSFDVSAQSLRLSGADAVFRTRVGKWKIQVEDVEVAVIIQQ